MFDVLGALFTFDTDNKIYRLSVKSTYELQWDFVHRKNQQNLPTKSLQCAWSGPAMKIEPFEIVRVRPTHINIPQRIAGLAGIPGSQKLVDGHGRKNQE